MKIAIELADKRTIDNYPPPTLSLNDALQRVMNEHPTWHTLRITLERIKEHR